MRQFRVGSAFGIPIELDLTFLLVLPLFAWIIASGIERQVELFNDVWMAGLDVTTLTTPAYLPWVIGVVVAVGLFVGVVFHELGHSIVAMRYGYPIDSITLWIFGGIAQFSEMPENWRQELTISIAGPIVSVVLGAVLYVGFVLLPPEMQVTRFATGYLALMNLALAGFNLLPAFPMDGGRVLRALLARSRPYARATNIAAEVGKAAAFLMGLVGLFTGQLLLIGIAFFVYIGAAGEAQQTALKAAFEGVTVRDVMTPADSLSTVSRETTIAGLVERMFEERHTGYPVIENGELVGLVTLEDAREVRPVEREAFLVEDVMTTDIKTVDIDADAMEAMTALQTNNIGRLVVEDRGEFVGLLTRSDLMTAFDVIQTGGSFTREDLSVTGADGTRGDPRFEK